MAEEFNLQRFLRILKIQLYRNRNNTVLFICILIATVLWFITALSKTYETYIEVPVEYRSLPKSKVPVNPLPDRLKILVEDDGWDLLWALLNPSSRKIKIDYQLAGSDGVVYTRYLHEDIAHQFGGNARVIDITPDTIAFHFERQISKKVPVILVYNITYAPQYGLNGSIMLNPSTVEVSGPESVVSQIDKWYSDTLKIRNLDREAAGKIALQKPRNPMITIQPPAVSYQIPVEKFTEKKLKVPVRVIKPENLQVLIIPDEVEITFQVFFSKYDAADPALFDLVVDLTGSLDDSQTSLPVQVKRAPDFVKNIRIKPQTVEFIILKSHG